MPDLETVLNRLRSRRLTSGVGPITVHDTSARKTASLSSVPRRHRGACSVCRRVILHSHAQAYRPSEVRRALRTLQAWQPFAALGLAAASYLLLTLYDVLALRHVGRTLPYGRVALASLTAYAFSHALGFASIIGPSIRYRVYTPLGLTAGEVAETSAFVIVTFTAGLVAVFPVIALLDPSSLEMLGISRPAGIAIGTLGLLRGRRE
jgi:uncharacterized membrane protein YbhN (UPF0104 family)